MAAAPGTGRRKQQSCCPIGGIGGKNLDILQRIIHQRSVRRQSYGNEAPTQRLPPKKQDTARI